MDYHDRVYGAVSIREPVLLELITSPSLQRLKGIDQAGYAEPWWPGTKHSRFEHSLGVMLLLQRYGAPLPEQIAGLLHDASHTAFSHCIDYALDGGSPTRQDHQDNALPEYLRRSEVPAILQRYGFSLANLLDDRNFPLKEQPLPELCADRLDYAMRDGLVYRLATAADVALLLQELTVINGRWAFASYPAAKRFAELFSRLNRDCYAGVKTAAMFSSVGGYLRHAISYGYLTPDDLYGTDEQVLSKIAVRHTQDSTLRELFARMDGKVPFRTDGTEHALRVVCKSRVVDPACWHNGKLLRVSEIDSHWATVVREESKPKEYFIKFSK